MAGKGALLRLGVYKKDGSQTTGGMPIPGARSASVMQAAAMVGGYQYSGE